MPVIWTFKEFRSCPLAVQGMDEISGLQGTCRVLVGPHVRSDARMWLSPNFRRRQLSRARHVGSSGCYSVVWCGNAWQTIFGMA